MTAAALPLTDTLRTVQSSRPSIRKRACVTLASPGACTAVARRATMRYAAQPMTTLLHPMQLSDELGRPNFGFSVKRCKTLLAISGESLEPALPRRYRDLLTPAMRRNKAVTVVFFIGEGVATLRQSHDAWDRVEMRQVCPYLCLRKTSRSKPARFSSQLAQRSAHFEASGGRRKGIHPFERSVLPLLLIALLA